MENTARKLWLLAFDAYKARKYSRRLERIVEKKLKLPQIVTIPSRMNPAVAAHGVGETAVSMLVGWISWSIFTAQCCIVDDWLSYRSSKNSLTLSPFCPDGFIDRCACRLLVGWSWEVVVTAFFRWITDTIALSMEQQVGVRFAILVLILCLSALTFYAFKNEDEAYKIDPYAPRTANTTTATSPPSSHRSPVSPPMSVVSNPLQGP